ncbi:MAG: ABC transporter permease subunit [Chloroflexia bacterium]
MTGSGLSSPLEHRGVLRILFFLIALTSILSLAYGLQAYAGGPLRPHVANPVTDLALTPTGALKVARWDGASWTTESPDALGYAGLYTSLAVDGAGELHIAYYDVAAGHLKYAHGQHSEWDIQVVDTGEWVGAYASLALDGEGRPHIAYCQLDVARQSCEGLRYAASEGARWITETVAAGSPLGAYASLALDRSGRPSIAYYEATSRTLQLASRSPSGWEVRTVDAGPEVGEYASLAIDPSGRPHIAYYDAGKGALKYAHLEGSRWVSETVDAGPEVGEYASLAIDPSGRPHIAYYDAGKGALKYAYLEGSGWVSETVDPGPGVGEYASIALDATGRPHIAYYDAANRALKYARFEGSAWVVETVDAQGDAGRYASLALDGDGRPVVSYYHVGGSLLAAGTSEGAIQVWKVDDGWQRTSLPGHNGAVVRVGFCPASCGMALLSVARDGTVRLWDVRTGDRLHEWNVGHSVRDAALSNDGTLLATVSDDNVVRLWKVPSGTIVHEFPADGQERLAVAISPDNLLLASGAGPGIQIWSTFSGNKVRDLVGQWENEANREKWLGHRKLVTALAFSPDRRTLVSGGADTLLVFWDVGVGRVTAEAEGHWAPLTKVVYDREGQMVLTGCQDAKARTWRSNSNYLASYIGHLGTVTAVAFGSDGSYLLTAGTDGTVRVWNTTTNAVQRIEWVRPGLFPFWNQVLTVWLLLSGLVGLVSLWGLWHRRIWGHHLALALYLLGPVLVLLPPILEVPSYPLPWGLQLQVGWPLLFMALWYVGLVVFLTWRAVASCYEAPYDRPLAEQLMSIRRTRQLREGIYVAAVWLVILVVLFSVLRRFNLDIAFMLHYLPFIMAGAGTTLYVSAASIALAVVLALLGALGRLSRNPIANGAAGFYVSLIRGTPLLVQVFIWYLGLPRLNITLQPVVAGILALGVNYGAYMTEIFRAGIQAIGKGQHEAAAALGMSGAQTFRRIVLPQAFRIVIPPIGNEFIAMMKDSALVSIITVWELTFRAQKIGRQYFRAIETFLIAAAFYWILTVIFQFLQGKLETYMARSERK